MTRVDDRWYLPIEGLASGFLTCLFPALLFGLADALSLFVGVVFGAVIAAHVLLFRGVHSAFRLTGFIATCVVAYVVSVFATMWSPFRPALLNFSGTGLGAIDSSQFFTGGFVGAAIICAGIYFFLAPSTNWPKFLLKAVCISAACGFLGVLGWSVSEQLDNARWLHGFGANLSFYALYIIWQTGAAILFGLLLPPRETPVATVVGVSPADVPTQKRRERDTPSLAAITFLILVFATLAMFVMREVLGYRMAHRMLAERQAAQRRFVAARPSGENLPAIVKLPVEQVLVLKPILGHPCGNILGAGDESPSLHLVSYGINYKRSEYASDVEAPFATATVRLYPNSDWAIYATKEGITSGVEAPIPQVVTTVIKFGSKVIMNTTMRYPNGVGDLYFYWASGSRFVLLRFHADQEDEFLKEYLARYPSTL